MKLELIKEPGIEQRVVLLPSHLNKFIFSGNKVLSEKDAGEKNLFSDKDYKESGAKPVLLTGEAVEKILGITYYYQLS